MANTKNSYKGTDQFLVKSKRSKALNRTYAENMNLNPNAFVNIPIEIDLGLSQRTYNRLLSHDIITISDLLQTRIIFDSVKS